MESGAERTLAREFVQIQGDGYRHELLPPHALLRQQIVAAAKESTSSQTLPFLFCTPDDVAEMTSLALSHGRAMAHLLVIDPACLAILRDKVRANPLLAEKIRVKRLVESHLCVPRTLQLCKAYLPLQVSPAISGQSAKFK